MNVLLESPWTIGIVGGLVAAGLIAGWFHTGQTRLGLASLGVIAMTLLGVMIERIIQTDREIVIATARQMAADIENNDLERVVDHVHSTQEPLRQLAQTYMRRFRFRRVSIKSNIDAAVDPRHSPPKAVVTFNVVIEDESSRQTLPQFVVLTLFQEGGRWRVFGFDHMPPMERVSAKDQLE